MVNITESQLKAMMELAYKEGLSGYKDLQEAIVTRILNQYINAGIIENYED